ncbi:MAG: ribonuclease P protein component [Candidatus Paceibacterota bacterium]|jgi:ribonuclease P protein component
MLPKKNRVDRKGVNLIFRKGRFVTSPSFAFKFTKINTDKNKKQISFIAPKNIAKLAVKRNLLRRRGYSALKKYIGQFPYGILGVFVFKKYQDNILTIENEIKDILNKLN